MDLIPALEIGLWNAWIFCFYHFIADVTVLFLINKKALKKVYEVLLPILNKKERINYYFENTFFLALSIYSIFVPLKLGTGWFYAGLLVFLAGAVVHTVSLVNYATTPVDAVVTKGFYQVSRHPLYFSAYLLFIGASIASTSLVLFIGTLVWIISDCFNMIAEERFLLGKYGDAYREYMNKTPRYFLFFEGDRRQNKTC